MKRNYSLLILSLCVLLMGITFHLEPSKAIEGNPVYLSDKEASLTVSLDDIGTKRENVSLSCYQVGTVYGNLESFIPVEDFSSLGLNLNDLGTTDKHKNAVNTLVDALEKDNSIKPLQVGKTDSKGQYTFSNLPHGMYLIVQDDNFKTYGTIQSFLVSVPYLENNVILYQVETQTKGEKPVEKTPGTKTDDESSLGLYLPIAVLSLAAILLVRKKHV